MRLMKLEPIIKSEVSQKEKYQYSTLTHILETAMALHSSTLAWKIPWTEEPGGPQSMGSLRVGHDLATEQQSRQNTFSCSLNICSLSLLLNLLSYYFKNFKTL